MDCSFQLDEKAFERKRARNAMFKYLYCCSEGEPAPDNEEEKRYIPFSQFWTATKECRNIETISIPDNLVIDIETLNDRLPKLKDVIIRIEQEDRHITAVHFRAYFCKRLFIGKDGVTMNDYPNHKLKKAVRIVPYLPELFPRIEKVHVCRDAISEMLDYKYPKTDFIYPIAGFNMEYGAIDLGLEVLQQAKDCL